MNWVIGSSVILDSTLLDLSGEIDICEPVRKALHTCLLKTATN